MRLLFLMAIAAMQLTTLVAQVDQLLLMDSVRQFPNDSRIRLLLAKRFAQSREFNQVIRLYEVQKDTLHNPDAVKLLAYSYIMQFEKKVIAQKLIEIAAGDPSEKLLARILAIDPGDLEAFYLTGIRFRVKNEPEKAELVFREIIKKQVPCADYFADVWSEYSKLLIAQERYGENQKLLAQRAVDEPTDPMSMIRAALSNIYVKKYGDATNLFYAGIRSLDHDLELKTLFDEAKPIATGQEIRTWDSLTTPDKKSKFLILFWKRRAPNLVDSVNHRLIEHYERLNYARDHYQKPSVPYYDDRGLIYIRMGKPDKVHSDFYSESWVYERAQPKAIYDFVSVNGIFEYRPLSDALLAVIDPEGQFEMLKELYVGRMNVDPVYQNIGAKISQLNSELESVPTSQKHVMVNGLMQTFEQRELIKVSQKFYAESDKQAARQFYTLETGVPIIHMNANFSAFRGQNGKSRLDFYYMIPLDELRTLLIDNNEKKSFVRMHIKIFDESFELAADQDREFTTLHRDTDVPHFIVDELRSVLKPGKYEIGIDIRNNHNDRLGIYKTQVALRDFSENPFMISDIEPSISVSKGIIKDKFVKPDTDVRVVPNPASTIPREKPFCVYYELYNLTPDAKGETHFESSYTIQKLRGTGFFSRIGNIFTGQKSSITSVTEKQGSLPTEREFLEFDISDLGEGEARLDVVVKDMVSGQKVKNSIAFYIK